MALTKVQHSIIETGSFIAANIADAASSANVSNKYVGQYVWDTTNNRLMRASGGAPDAAWYVVDGSSSVTPA